MKTIKFTRIEDDYLSARVGATEIRFFCGTTGVDFEIFVWGIEKDLKCNVGEDCKLAETERCNWARCKRMVKMPSLEDSFYTGDSYSSMAQEQGIEDWKTNPVARIKLIKGFVLSVLNNTDNILPLDAKTDYPKADKKAFETIPWEVEGVIF